MFGAKKCKEASASLFAGKNSPLNQERKAEKTPLNK